MTYPKKLMSISELIVIGYSEEYLRRVAHHKLAHKFIKRTSAAKNSKILFDTDMLDKLQSSGEVR